ncbi:MAG: hypothetical protein OXQ28_11725 [Acidobacteriota bacterium]|nr:hypothetical protein [Acidobacteriota bacterium]
MSLFAVEQQFNGDRSLIIEADTVVSADGWRVFRNADASPPVARPPGGIGAIDPFPLGEGRAHEWSGITSAGEVRLRHDDVKVPPSTNQLFVVMMRRGRTSAVVIEAASAVAIDARWVFRNAHGHSIAELPATDVSHVETVHNRPAGR